MNKTIVFDMDGTIGDLYGVEDWLSALRNEDVRPYVEAKPMYNMLVLNELLKILKDCGWKVVVTTWLSKGSSKAYDALVREAKIEWLERYDFPFDEIHLVKFGTTKANCTRHIGGFQVLVDDNEQVRKGWNLGATIDANENIIEALLKLLEKEVF